MARMRLRNGRVLEFAWNEEQGVWIFRVLQGSVFITPKLAMTVKEFHVLFKHHRVQLGDWLTLDRNLGEFTIDFKQKWSVRENWQEFYQLAQSERDDPIRGFSE